MNVLPSPASIRDDAAVDPDAVSRQRRAVSDILDSADDRLLVIVGPCSAHDPKSMIEYARSLAPLAREVDDDLYLVVRAYTEKPRTRHGWPGMMLDPDLDGGYDVVAGIRRVRRMLEQVAGSGLPIATEFVDPMLAPYVEDLIAWGAIGARTVESPTHRRLASALSMPIGMKNRTDGAVGPAVDAIATAAEPQPIVELCETGDPISRISAGNPHTHLVLRGGDTGTNYHAHQVEHALAELARIQSAPRLVVDCSHGNSGKDHRRQPVVARAIAEQVAAGQHGVAGVMLESFIGEGRQSISRDLEYGVSVTDACLSLSQTAVIVHELAQAAASRRARSPYRAQLVEAK